MGLLLIFTIYPAVGIHLLLQKSINIVHIFPVQAVQRKVDGQEGNNFSIALHDRSALEI